MREFQVRSINRRRLKTSSGSLLLGSNFRLTHWLPCRPSTHDIDCSIVLNGISSGTLFSQWFIEWTKFHYDLWRVSKLNNSLLGLQTCKHCYMTVLTRRAYENRLHSVEFLISLVAKLHLLQWISQSNTSVSSNFHYNWYHNTVLQFQISSLQFVEFYGYNFHHISILIDK